MHWNEAVLTDWLNRNNHSAWSTNRGFHKKDPDQRIVQHPHKLEIWNLKIWKRVQQASWASFSDKYAGSKAGRVSHHFPFLVAIFHLFLLPKSSGLRLLQLLASWRCQREQRPSSYSGEMLFVLTATCQKHQYQHLYDVTEICISKATSVPPPWPGQQTRILWEIRGIRGSSCLQVVTWWGRMPLNLKMVAIEIFEV